MRAALYIVLALLLTAVAAAILIPGLLVPASKISNERNASVSMKTLAVAQADFRANDRDGNGKQDYWRGDIVGLYTIQPKGSPAPIKLIELSVAGADDRPKSDITPWSSPSPKAGYWYRTLLHETEETPGPDRFAAMAHPDSYREGWRNTFIISEKNTVYRLDFGRKGGAAFYPADPAAQGWPQLD